MLATKAFSTLLTLEAFEMFTQWITYPVLAVRRLPHCNTSDTPYRWFTGPRRHRRWSDPLPQSCTHALRQQGTHSSTCGHGALNARWLLEVVVPTQFVLFNISAIVGSAILYGDFARATFHQIVTFLYGCGATFAGVFIIAWAPTTPPDQPLEEEEEGTIGDAQLSEADGTAGLSSRSGSVAYRSRVRVLAADGTPATPILRNRQSIVSMYGLSPAQVRCQPLALY